MQRSETFLDWKNPNRYNDRTWIQGCGDVSVSRPGLGPAGQRTDVRSGCGSSSSISRPQPLTSPPCQRQGYGTGLPSGLSKGAKGLGDRGSPEQQTLASHFPLQVGSGEPSLRRADAGHLAALLACLCERGLPRLCLERSRPCLGCLRPDSGAVAGSRWGLGSPPWRCFWWAAPADGVGREARRQGRRTLVPPGLPAASPWGPHCLSTELAQLGSLFARGLPTGPVSNSDEPIPDAQGDCHVCTLLVGT